MLFRGILRAKEEKNTYDERLFAVISAFFMDWLGTLLDLPRGFVGLEPA